MRTPALLLAASMLAACSEIQPTDSHLTSRDWAKAGDKRAAEPATFYCYRTIGRPDCYYAPLPGADGRLIQGGPQPPEAAALEARTQPMPAETVAAAATPEPMAAAETAVAEPEADGEAPGFFDRAIGFFGL